MPKTVTTARACEIARLDPTRLNSEIARENFTCLPQTERRIGRRFQDFDVVAVSIFSMLLALRVAPAKAGEMACEARSLIRTSQADLWFYVTPGSSDDGKVGVLFDLEMNQGTYETDRKHYEAAEKIRIAKSVGEPGHDDPAATPFLAMHSNPPEMELRIPLAAILRRVRSEMSEGDFIEL